MAEKTNDKKDLNKIKTPHIGKVLRKYASEKRLRLAVWARTQGVNYQAVLRYLKNPALKTDTLFDICLVLKYNFFRDIANALPAEFPPFEQNPKDAEMEELKKENEKLKNEVALLKEILGAKR